MGSGIMLKQETKYQNRTTKMTHWMVRRLEVFFRSLTCLNAGDAGGVEYPLHLSGAHWNCPQSPQLGREERN